MAESKYKNLRDELDKTFLELSKKKFNQDDNKNLVAAIGKDLLDSVTPILETIAQNNRISQSELKQILSEMKFDVPQIESPQIDHEGLKQTLREAISEAFGKIKYPEPKVNVEVPPTIFPQFPKYPEAQKLPIPLPVSLSGVTNKYPVPVILTDDKGNPYVASYTSRGVVAGGGGGGRGVVEINNISTLSGDSAMDSANKAVRVNIITGSLSYDTNIGPSGANTLRVTMATDAVSSVNVTGFTSSVAANLQNAAGTSYDTGTGLPINLIQVSGNTIAAGIGEANANSLRIVQASDVASSVNVTQLGGSNIAMDSGVTGGGVQRTVHVVDVASSTNTIQLAGTAVAVDSGVTGAGVQRIIHVTDVATSTNTIQLGGTAISTDIGDTSAGTQRIVLVRSPNATTTSVSIGADAATEVVPTNLSRKSIIITHASTSNLYVSTGTASSTAAFPIVANQVVGFDDYTGRITAIAQEQAGTISLRYMEIS